MISRAFLKSLSSSTGGTSENISSDLHARARDTLLMWLLRDGPRSCLGLWKHHREGGFLPADAPGRHRTQNCSLHIVPAYRKPGRRFAPFSPRSSGESQLGLGYIRQERRSVTVTAFIGLAPVILNPAEVLAVIALLTPLTWMEVVGPDRRFSRSASSGVGFSQKAPAWGDRLGLPGFSFTLGSVPSQKDLSSVSMLLLLFALTTFILSFFRKASENTLLPNLAELNSPPEQW